MRPQHIVLESRTGASQAVRQPSHLTDAVLQPAHSMALWQCLHSSLMGREQLARNGE
jgi:hypothetical protein